LKFYQKCGPGWIRADQDWFLKFADGSLGEDTMLFADSLCRSARSGILSLAGRLATLCGSKLGWRLLDTLPSKASKPNSTYAGTANIGLSTLPSMPL